jgi:hypothetical protein
MNNFINFLETQDNINFLRGLFADNANVNILFDWLEEIGLIDVKSSMLSIISSINSGTNNLDIDDHYTKIKSDINHLDSKIQFWILNIFFAHIKKMYADKLSKLTIKQTDLKDRFNDLIKALQDNESFSKVLIVLRDLQSELNFGDRNPQLYATVVSMYQVMSVFQKR